MDTDRAAADFDAVEDEVIGLGPNLLLFTYLIRLLLWKPNDWPYFASFAARKAFRSRSIGPRSFGPNR
jgi:hypothetical protein